MRRQGNQWGLSTDDNFTSNRRVSFLWGVSSSEVPTHCNCATGYFQHPRIDRKASSRRSTLDAVTFSILYHVSCRLDELKPNEMANYRPISPKMQLHGVSAWIEESSSWPDVHLWLDMTGATHVQQQLLYIQPLRPHLQCSFYAFCVYLL